jgi:hypothetical protein
MHQEELTEYSQNQVNIRQIHDKYTKNTYFNILLILIDDPINYLPINFNLTHE